MADYANLVLFPSLNSVFVAFFFALFLRFFKLSFKYLALFALFLIKAIFFNPFILFIQTFKTGTFLSENFIAELKFCLCLNIALFALLLSIH